ncbi:MAG: SIS domain-containing protein [Chloroflexi bacterium]|nr:SIS domain-containing protein [Chloroflexota bacterium]
MLEKSKLTNAVMENMWMEIIHQGEYTLQNLDAIKQQIYKVFSDFNEVENVYLVGSGDSYYAGIAVQSAFSKWTGIEVHPVTAFEFQGYLSDFLPANSLVITISITGESVATVTSARVAKGEDSQVLALTCNPKSALAREASNTIDMLLRPSEPGPTPGTSTYIASLTTLYLIALELGKRLGKLQENEYQKNYETIIAILGEIRHQALVISPVILNYVLDKVNSGDEIHFTGSGPNYATALIGSAKLLETAIHPSIPQYTDEWAHEQLYLVNPKTHVFFIQEPGPSLSRVEELIRTAVSFGAKVVVLRRDDQDHLDLGGVNYWRIAINTGELFSPIAYAFALCLFAYHLGKKLGKRPFGFDDSNRENIAKTAIYCYRRK